MDGAGLGANSELSREQWLAAGFAEESSAESAVSSDPNVPAEAAIMAHRYFSDAEILAAPNVPGPKFD
jgi:hypothetical protein